MSKCRRRASIGPFDLRLGLCTTRHAWWMGLDDLCWDAVSRCLVSEGRRFLLWFLLCFYPPEKTQHMKGKMVSYLYIYILTFKTHTHIIYTHLYTYICAYLDTYVYFIICVWWDACNGDSLTKVLFREGWTLMDWIWSLLEYLVLHYGKLVSITHILFQWLIMFVCMCIYIYLYLWYI